MADDAVTSTRWRGPHVQSSPNSAQKEAKKGEDRITETGNAILTVLKERIVEFTTVAKSVGTMNKTLTSLRSEMAAIKRKQDSATLDEEPSEEPPEKRPRGENESESNNGDEELDNFLTAEQIETDSQEDTDLFDIL